MLKLFWEGAKIPTFHISLYESKAQTVISAPQNDAVSRRYGSPSTSLLLFPDFITPHYLARFFFDTLRNCLINPCLDETGLTLFGA